MLGDVLNQRRVVQHLAVGAAAEDGGEIEAETIDVHLGDPFDQAVEDEVAHERMIAVEGIAAAGKIVIATFFIQHVIDVVVQAAETAASGRFRCPRWCGCKPHRE